MKMIVNSKVIESVSEKRGDRYVTYEFTSSFGDTGRIGPILEDADTDIQAKTLLLEQQFLSDLKEKELNTAYDLVLREGINPATLVFKYNVKAVIINDLYSSKLLPKEQVIINSLSKIQNIKNKVKLFLGLI